MNETRTTFPSPRAKTRAQVITDFGVPGLNGVGAGSKPAPCGATLRTFTLHCAEQLPVPEDNGKVISGHTMQPTD